VKAPEIESSKIGTILWVAVGIIICAVAVVAVPNFIQSRSMCCSNACINNLRQIDAAASQFALEQHKTNGDAIHFPNDLTPYIKLNSAGQIPPCPDGGAYTLKKVGDTPKCSIGSTVTPAHVLP
jgi:hypothetical protein